MKRMAMLMAVCLLLPGISSGKEKHFKRQEKFPGGRQIRSAIGSLFSGLKDVNVVEYTFDASYDDVWRAVQGSAKKFAKVGGRPVVAVDQQNGRVQNGRITENALIGSGATAWIDQFNMEATELTPNQTKVTVIRKVVERQLSGQWKTVWSNSKIERWLLTQVEDDLKSPQAVAAQSQEDPMLKALAGKYKGQYNTFDELELRPDGSFAMLMSGTEVGGRYEVKDDYVTLHIESQGGQSLGTYRPQQKGKIENGKLAGIWGQIWTKERAETPSQSGPLEVLTNEDVIRMVEAQLPDSVVISKIQSSTCAFDTSTDALIELKQAGVSNDIIKAMVQAGSK